MKRSGAFRSSEKFSFAALIILLFIIFLFPVRPAVPSYPYERVAAISKGKLLVATQNINDPSFMKTVILLTSYGEYGAAGLVINRPGRVGLSTLFPNTKAFKDWRETLFIGGPVDPHKISFLIRSAKQPEDTSRVFKDVYIAGIKGVLQSIPAEGSELKARAYIGYAGWASGQLEKEVMRGDWLVVDGDAAAVFDKDHELIWEKIYRRWSTQEVALLSSGRTR